MRAAGRRTRFVSVGVSLLVQAVLLALLIIVPLFAAGKLPAMQWQAPTPIFRRGDPGAPPPIGDKIKSDNGGQSNSDKPRPPITVFQPREVPDRIDTTPDGSSHASSRGAGYPDAPDIPGSVSSDLRVDSFTKTPVDVLPPPAPRTPVKVHKDIMAARLIHRVQPCYPPLARQARLSGEVQLRAIIAADGSVQALQVLSGHPLFYSCATEAVQQWRYTPTLLNGQPVEVETFVTVRFVLGQR